MKFRLAIVVIIAVTTLKFINKVGAKKRWYKRIESLNLNKFFNRFLDWKITVILPCANGSLTDLYKSVLEFIENIPKNGGTINDCFLYPVGTICLGNYSLSKNFLIYWLIVLTE